MPPSSQRLKSFLSAYGYWTLALVLIVILFRALEHTSVAGEVSLIDGGSTLLAGLLNDFVFSLGYAALISVPAFFIWCRRPGAARLFFGVLALLYLLLHAALVRYYLTTKTLLGADLFGYSMNDIKTTIGSSASFALSDLIPLLFFTLFLLLLRFIGKRAVQLDARLTAAMLFAGVLGLFATNRVHGRQGTASEYLSLSKSGYFFNANLQRKKLPTKAIAFEGYPLMRPDDSRDALTPYFNLGAAKPNIVFLIIEGLGRDFTGKGAGYGGFTPFLDSLTVHSLYWTNFLSSAGRSFAGLPSILASLPYSKNGFNELGQNMPDHSSLVRMLKQNGYRTNFFYGGNANFDLQDIFLERQGNDFILDENKFGQGYSRSFGSKYSWGYADGDLYKRSLELLAPQTTEPLLNIYFTLSTHEPFAVPNDEAYKQKVEATLAKLSAADKEKYAPYKEVWKALLYSDESIRSFFAAYAKRPDFANTIFVITGDHRLIPVPEQNSASRFHVPLLIYSPLLKQPATFTALSSHLDITPSLVQLLRHHPDLNFPTSVSWLGRGLATATTFAPDYEMPLMRNKNVLEDYIEGNHLLSGSQLYNIKDGLMLEPIEDAFVKNRLQAKLDSFRQLNDYLCTQNKILDADKSLLTAATKTNFAPEEQRMVDSLSGGQTLPDTLFMRARNHAFAGNYKPARLLCRKVLAGSPNYHDVRVLYGRTYAWDKQYATAAAAFKEVIRRDPGFEDAYLAWIDTELWAGKKDSAKLLIKAALQVLPNSLHLKEKEAKLLAAK